MKKILISLSIVGAVAAIAVGGTIAYFSDTETSTGNTFTAGTIDIAVNGENPWSETGTLSVVDMKPSQHEYTEYVIHNVGSNPANVFKKVSNFNEDDGIISEPECDLGGGIWTQGEQTQCSGSYEAVVDVSSVVRYDMSVWVYNVDPATNPEAQPIWWQVIYTDEMGKTLQNLNDVDVLLGMIPKDWYMKVQQSYHMDSNAGNEYQGDAMSFDITLTAEQLKNTVVLENKLFPAGEEPTIVHGDGIDATVAYVVKDATFDYTLTVNGMPAGPYTLIAWDDTANSYTFNWNNRGSAIALANISGSGTVSGSLDLNDDLINAKLWLITGTYTPGTAVGLFGWNPSGLFETALMDYYDSLQ